MRPRGHGAGSSDWPITIINLQAQALPCQVGLNLPECLGRLAPQHTFGRAVAGKGMASEIIMRGVPDVLHDARINVAQINKARRKYIAGTGRGDGKKNNAGVVTAMSAKRVPVTDRVLGASFYCRT